MVKISGNDKVNTTLVYRSKLEHVLSEGRFAVTAEIGPPKGADPQKIVEKAEHINSFADAYNITDNQTAVVRLSSLAGSCLLLNIKMEPIMQLTCRDRNRIALQSDILGAAAVGIRNILCLTGDHQFFGNHPDAKGVYDLDSVQLIQVVRNMRDSGLFQNGEEIIGGKPVVYIGGAANPFADPFEAHILRLEKKICAGVDFIQTQSVYDITLFGRWIDEVRSLGFDKKVHVLAGVTPLKSMKMTERMKFHVPGVEVSDEVYRRMKQASDPKKEGYDIALETLRNLRNMTGVHGVHITALFWEEIIPELVKESGLYPRPY